MNYSVQALVLVRQSKISIITAHLQSFFYPLKKYHVSRPTALRFDLHLRSNECFLLPFFCFVRTPAVGVNEHLICQRFCLSVNVQPSTR